MTPRVCMHALSHNDKNGGKIETLVNIASLVPNPSHNTRIIITTHVASTQAGIYPAPMSPVYAASKAAG